MPPPASAPCRRGPSASVMRRAAKNLPLLLRFLRCRLLLPLGVAAALRTVPLAAFTQVST